MIQETIKKETDTNSFLKLIVDEIYKNSKDPKSDYYLPKIATESANPKLEPYDADSLDIGDLDLPGDVLCIQETIIQPDAEGPPNLDLSQVIVTGLSNVQFASEPIVDDKDYSVSSTLVFSNVEGYPKPLKFNGNFDVKQTCKWPPEAKKDPDTFIAEPVGTFETTIKSANASLTFSVDTSQTELIMTVNEFTLSVDPNNAHTTVKIKQKDPDWDRFIEEALNDPTTFTNVLHQLNTKFNDPEKLSSLSDFLTKKLNEMMSELA